MRLSDLIPVLQVAIGPVIVVSGIALLLLTMTNRFGRIIDRARQVAHEPEGERTTAQLRVLLTRARIVRAAIASAAVAVLLAALLIIVLFFEALMRAGGAGPVALLFVSCMACLIVSLLLFISDINLSLRALKLEVTPE